MDSRRGALDADQVDLILANLPLDASFADENDVLLFWQGETYRTCDPEYIGRDVRDCHPAHTLAVLEEILRAFKSGEKDVAEGWSADEKGRFRFTRYVATRDASGVYKGILELNMDVTGLRGLTGTQDLPGWGDVDA
jgi:hypothetical protein